MKKNSGFLRFLVQCFFVLAVAFITTACGGGGGAFVSSSPPGDDLGGVNPAQAQELLHAEPTSIGDVTAAISNDAKVVIFWEDISQSEDGFDVWKDGKKVGSVAKNVSSWVDAEATNGNKACYQVVAYNKEWKTFSEKKCFSIFMPEIFVMPAFVMGECDIMRDGAVFEGKLYLVWLVFNSLCTGPEKAYLSIFSSDDSDAMEALRIEIPTITNASSVAVDRNAIYIGGNVGDRGVIVALDHTDLTQKWEVFLEYGSSIRGVTAQDNDVFIAGSVVGSEAYDILVARFDLDGNYIWSERWGTSCYDWGEYVISANGGVDVYGKAGQLCLIMSPDTPAPEYQGDVVLHYGYE